MLWSISFIVYWLMLHSAAKHLDTYGYDLCKKYTSQFSLTLLRFIINFRLQKLLNAVTFFLYAVWRHWIAQYGKWVGNLFLWILSLHCKKFENGCKWCEKLRICNKKWDNLKIKEFHAISWIIANYTKVSWLQFV